jgi:threonine synthase
MPAGCPVCSEERFPTNVAPVYEKLPGFKSGKLSGRGLMRFLPQLPVSRDGLVSLGEGATPLLAVSGLGSGIGLPRLLVKDERRNPTGSWRDRYAAVALSQVDEAATTAGSAVDEATCVSIAAYAARAGVRSVGVVSPGVSGRARDAIDGVGGRTVAVDGAPEQWMLLSRAEQALGWRAFTNRTTPPIGGDPIATEGYKTIAYEIADTLGAAPDVVCVPTAYGEGLFGIWKGFDELRRLGRTGRAPRMVASEPAGGPLGVATPDRPIVRVPRTPTVARGIGGSINSYIAVAALSASDGLVAQPNDAQIMDAQHRLAAAGFFVEPASAAGLAGLRILAAQRRLPPGSRIVVVNTSSGLKNLESLEPADISDAR